MNRKNILVLTQWSYRDPLIQAYTLPYVKIIAEKIPAGSRIYLVMFEQERLRMSKQEKEKVRSELSKKGIIWIDYKYSRFGVIGFIKWFISFIQLFGIIITKKIEYIHPWGTPAGALGYLLSIFTGRKLVIDSYEPHAEAMVENETWSRKGMKYKLLFFLEKKLSRRADYFISATEGMREYAKRKYGIEVKNFFVKPACVDLKIFTPSRRKSKKLLSELSLENKIVCVYAGKFGGIYLTKEVFAFFSEAEKKWGNQFRALLLTPNKTEELNEWAKANNFTAENMVIRFVPHDEIPDYMGLGDFAFTPVKPIPTKRYCTPIKDGEYWALGLPVVITKDISDDSDIIRSNNAGAVIESLDRQSYKKALDQIEELLKSSTVELGDNIRKLAVQYRSFEIAEDIYKKIYG